MFLNRQLERRENGKEGRAIGVIKGKDSQIESGYTTYSMCNCFE